MSILIATQGWNYAAWVGPFYPPGTRPSEFLPVYARAFRRVTMLELVERPTADFHYVRWMGPDRDLTDYSRLQFDRSKEIRAWAEALKRAAHTKDIYGFFNNHFAGHSPANARAMQRELGQQPVEPEALRGQRSLF